MMKVLGGTVFRSWSNAAVAKFFLEGLEERMKRMIEQSNELITQLNQLEEIEVKKVENGTNVVFLTSSKIDLKKFAKAVNNQHGIWMNYPDNGKIQIHFNESILLKSNEQLLTVFKDSILSAK